MDSPSSQLNPHTPVTQQLANFLRIIKASQQIKPYLELLFFGLLHFCTILA